MSVSLTSFLICIVTSNILIVILYLLFRVSGKKIYIAPRYLFLIVVMILARSFIPYEFFYTVTLISREFLPWIQSIGDYQISSGIRLYQIVYLTWAVGAAWRLFYVCRRQITLERKIASLPNSRHMPLLRDLLKTKNITKEIGLIQIPSVVSPALIGLWRPKIIIPSDIHQDELYFILLHELEHYKRKDLHLISFLQIACCIYWWNPFFYILETIARDIMEFRVDDAVTKQLSPVQRLDYLQSILNIAKKYEKADRKFIVKMGYAEKENKLSKRFDFVLTEKTKDRGPLLTSIMLVVIIISTVIIVEPYSMRESDKQEESFVISSESFLIEVDGKYELYIGGVYSHTVNNCSAFEHLNIYESREEYENENNKRGSDFFWNRAADLIITQ